MADTIMLSWFSHGAFTNWEMLLLDLMQEDDWLTKFLWFWLAENFPAIWLVHLNFGRNNQLRFWNCSFCVWFFLLILFALFYCLCPLWRGWMNGQARVNIEWVTPSDVSKCCIFCSNFCRRNKCEFLNEVSIFLFAADNCYNKSF